MTELSFEAALTVTGREVTASWHLLTYTIIETWAGYAGVHHCKDDINQTIKHILNTVSAFTINTEV